MIEEFLSLCLRCVCNAPCFRIYGKARAERHWRVINVYANHFYNYESKVPLARGSCVTLSSRDILIGWDFANEVIEEQVYEPTSREFPVEVCSGRLNDFPRRAKAGAEPWPTTGEILAHECGHTWQSLRIGPIYLPLVGSVTLFQEGPFAWNRFENEASEQGMFGGIVKGTVCERLMPVLRRRRSNQ